MLDLDKCIARVRQCQVLAEDDMRALCDRVLTIISEESNMQAVPAPVTVCGDIHGQFHDLLRLFEVAGACPDTRYVFMGDFVDRGHHSLETLTLLLLLKARYPERVFLIRGNHECRQITQVYGFYDECVAKYGSAAVWRACCAVFDFFSVAALIDGRVLCVHGGLSPEIPTLDQAQTLRRTQEIPHSGALCDLVWSDPEDLEGGAWAVSPRGAGYLFGARVTAEFCHLNGLSLIARAHQLVQEGYRFMFPDRQLVTIWSAPNYCYRCGNSAAVMRIEDAAAPIDDACFRVFESTTDAEEILAAMAQQAAASRSAARLYFQ